MSGGIALEFRDRWPVMHAEYVRRCRTGELRPGDVLPWEADGVVIYNLMTQQRSGRDARLDAVGTSVATALADAAGRGIAVLALPRIGAGIGGLDWPDVEAVLLAAEAASPVELVVAVLPRR